jgi:hypothetical protein
MSQPPLSSFKNNLSDSIQFVKTSFNSKFCQVTPPISLLIQSLSALLSILCQHFWVPEFWTLRLTQTVLRTTWHTWANGHKPCIRESMRMHFQISSDSTCNMIQPELVAIPAILQYYKQCYAASWAWQRCKKAEQLHFVHDL